MTLNELTAMVDLFNRRRNWHKVHTSKDLATAISIEASELLALYLWSYELADDKRQDAAHEVADVLIYVLAYCKANGIDPESAVLSKLAINESRFSVC